jgi:hypothetical protein
MNEFDVGRRSGSRWHTCSFSVGFLLSLLKYGTTAVVVVVVVVVASAATQQPNASALS